MSKEIKETFYPTDKAAWRQWLAENHNKKQSIWMIRYNKDSKIPTISWSEAVDEALCFGWIDSVVNKYESEGVIQYFCPRKPNGTWSKVNKLKIIQLIESGQMTESGLAVIEKAKQNGSWTILDTVEDLVVPEDLEAEFSNNPTAKTFYEQLTKSAKKTILYHLVSAKRPETRQKRIAEIIENANQNQK